MTTENGAKPTKPIFNFDDLSWKESKAFSLAHSKLVQSLEENDPDALESSFETYDELMAKVVEYVPREWCVSSAPDNLDWSDPASFDYIKGVKMTRLRELMTEAREEAAKN